MMTNNVTGFSPAGKLSWVYRVGQNLKQESWATAKMTARCAIWVPWKFPRVP